MIYYAKSKPMQQWIAATEKGLCFVGKENGEKGEMILWFEKNRKNIEIEENNTKMALYLQSFQNYFEGVIKQFQVPLDLKATPFTMAVWHQILKIPYGKTISYSEIAKKIEQPKAIRAVGAAARVNPLLIVIPCHRVIGKSGKLTGYRGGIAMKEKLLRHEGVLLRGKWMENSVHSFYLM